MRQEYSIYQNYSNKGQKRNKLLIANFFWLLIALIIPNIILGFTEHQSFLVFATNLILPLGMFWVAESSSTKPIFSTLILLPFMILGGFQIVLFFLFGNGIIAVDMFLNVFTTNFSEATELLSSLPIAIGLVILLYIPPIITAIIAWVKGWRLRIEFIHNNFIIGWLLVILGAGLFGSSFLIKPHVVADKDIFPFNVCYNLTVAIRRDIHFKRYAQDPPSYRFFPTKTHPDSIPELYVLVIGETSRADNWEIFGYDRPTNPHLKDLDGVVGFGKAMSESNVTHKSVPMLLSHLNSDNFADSLRHVRSIISAFKEAGFTTTAISNQERNRSFIDYFVDEADTCIRLHDRNEGKRLYDAEMIPYIRRDIEKAGKKHLIVVHTYGSHFKYNDRYPDSLAIFKPDSPLDANYKLRPELINAYDNTIAYTSLLLSTIANEIKESGRVGAMLYTSDHGEDIYDDKSRHFLHASPRPSYFQLHVPLLIWFSPEYIALFPDIVENAKANSGKQVSSTSSFFPTAMELAGINSFSADSTASIINNNYRHKSAKYLTDREEAVDITAYGIKLP